MSTSGTTNVKDALFQLTTQIFSPKGGKHQDYYEVLGINKKATMKEVREGYYKAAKQWHPDKNTHDPRAEARFKLISEAYEVLSDADKRKAYDKGGVEGLEAHEAFSRIDLRSVVRALFGGGEFDDLVGEVADLPMVKQLLKRSMSGEDEEEATKKEAAKKEVKDSLADLEREIEKANQEEAEERRLQAEEEEVCKELARKLAARITPRARGEKSSDQFAQESRAWAKGLAEAPGGLDLVAMISAVWRVRGRSYERRLFGLESIIIEVKDFFSRVGQGISIMRGAMRASKLTQDVVTKQQALAVQAKANTTKAANASNATKASNATNASKQQGEEEEEDFELPEKEMRNVAKAGLDVMWRTGLYFLQQRVRRVTTLMMDKAREDHRADPSKVSTEQLGTALRELGLHLRDVWTEASKTLPAGVPLRMDDQDPSAPTPDGGSSGSGSGSDAKGGKRPPPS